MSGRRQSIPYFSEPSSIARASTRGVGLPIRRNWSGDFSVTCCGTGIAIASGASSP